MPFEAIEYPFNIIEMKNLIKLSLVLIFILSISSNTFANSKEVKTDTLMVAGVCGMCEERIENAALIKGVKKADWSQDTHELIVVYRPDKVSLDEIAIAVSEIGHDNSIYNSTDEQYEKVHSCCKYREQDSH